MNRLAVLLAGSMLVAVPCLAADRYTEPRDCDTPSSDTPVCRYNKSWTADAAAAALGIRTVTAFSEGDVLTVIARRKAPSLSLCCSIDAPFERIEGSDFWTLSVRVFDIDHAIIDVELIPSVSNHDATTYYGALVPRPAASDPLHGTLRLESIQSAALGEERKLTIYLPPGHDRAKTYPVLYMADGATVVSFATAIDALIDAGRIRPLIVAGLWPGTSQAEERAFEYLPGRSDQRFREHSAFAIDEVMPYAEKTYGASSRREDRMIAGFSDGAAWALSMGLHNRDRFGTVAALSFGWPKAADNLGQSNEPRLYFGSGILEPYFHGVTEHTARHAQGLGDEVLLEHFTSGHAAAAWRYMLLDALLWTFPASKS